MASCTYTVPDKDASGDNLYGPRICWQEFIDWAWNAHGFKKKYWDDGFGYYDVCNNNKPLARTLAAMWLLNYSASDHWNEQWSNDMLHWARRYVRNQIDDLRSKCGDGSAIATTWSGFWVNDRVELYMGFFYNRDVVERAGVLVHESRHAGGKSHNANFPSGSVYGTGDQADSSWNYKGAWMYHALYLWWFYAAGTRTTSALRQSARQRGNLIIDNAFATHPGFNI